MTNRLRVQPHVTKLRAILLTLVNSELAKCAITPKFYCNPNSDYPLGSVNAAMIHVSIMSNQEDDLIDYHKNITYIVKNSNFKDVQYYFSSSASFAYTMNDLDTLIFAGDNPLQNSGDRPRIYIGTSSDALNDFEDRVDDQNLDSYYSTSSSTISYNLMFHNVELEWNGSVELKLYFDPNKFWFMGHCKLITTDSNHDYPIEMNGEQASFLLFNNHWVFSRGGKGIGHSYTKHFYYVNQEIDFLDQGVYVGTWNCVWNNYYGDEVYIKDVVMTCTNMEQFIGNYFESSQFFHTLSQDNLQIWKMLNVTTKNCYQLGKPYSIESSCWSGDSCKNDGFEINGVYYLQELQGNPMKFLHGDLYFKTGFNPHISNIVIQGAQFDTTNDHSQWNIDFNFATEILFTNITYERCVFSNKSPFLHQQTSTQKVIAENFMYKECEFTYSGSWWSPFKSDQWLDLTYKNISAYDSTFQHSFLIDMKLTDPEFVINQIHVERCQFDQQSGIIRARDNNDAKTMLKVNNLDSWDNRFAGVDGSSIIVFFKMKNAEVHINNLWIKDGQLPDLISFNPDSPTEFKMTLINTVVEDVVCNMGPCQFYDSLEGNVPKKTFIFDGFHMKGVQVSGALLSKEFFNLPLDPVSNVSIRKFKMEECVIGETAQGYTIFRFYKGSIPINGFDVIRSSSIEPICTFTECISDLSGVSVVESYNLCLVDSRRSTLNILDSDIQINDNKDTTLVLQDQGEVSFMGNIIDVEGQVLNAQDGVTNFGTDNYIMFRGIQDAQEVPGVHAEKQMIYIKDETEFHFQDTFIPAFQAFESTLDINNALFFAGSPAMYTEESKVTITSLATHINGNVANGPYFIFERSQFLMTESQTTIQAHAGHVFHILNSQNAEISKSIFQGDEENGSTGQGSAVSNMNSRLLVQESEFKGIPSDFGSGIQQNCDKDKLAQCHLDVINSSFSDNIAEFNGPAIKYNSGSFVEEGNVYFGNVAIHEETDERPIANFPSRQNLVSDYEMIEYVENSMYQDEVCFELTDHYFNDALAGWYNGNMTIDVEYDSKDDVVLHDNTTYSYYEGRLRCIEQLKLAGKVGDVFEFNSTSEQIDMDLVNNQFVDYEHHIGHIPGVIIPDRPPCMDFIAEYCPAGQVIYEGQYCVTCPNGTYSLEPATKANPGECKACLQYSDCYEGKVIDINAGHWRSSNSTTVHVCRSPEGCLGGENSQCDEHYGGNMCNVCITPWYSKNYMGECKSCNFIAFHLLLSIAGYALYLFLIYFLVYISYRDNKDEIFSLQVMFRILINYMQISSILYVQKFQGRFMGFLQGFYSLYSVFPLLIDYECFAPNYEHYDAIHTGLGVMMVFVTFGLFAAFWKYYLTKIYRYFDYHEFLLNTMLVLFYLEHPMIMRKVFDNIVCTEIEEGEYWLLSNLNTPCLDLPWVLKVILLAFPIMLFFGVGYFIMQWMTLKIYTEKTLKMPYIQAYLGFLYHGYRKEQLRFQSIVSIRNVVYCLVVSSIRGVSPISQFYVGLSILLVYFEIVRRKQPYDDVDYQRLELVSVLVVISTLYLASDLGFSYQWQVIKHAFIFILQLLWFAYWYYVLKKKNPELVKHIIDIILCRKRPKQQIDKSYKFSDVDLDNSQRNSQILPLREEQDKSPSPEESNETVELKNPKVEHIPTPQYKQKKRNIKERVLNERPVRVISEHMSTNKEIRDNIKQQKIRNEDAPRDNGDGGVDGDQEIYFST